MAAHCSGCVFMVCVCAFTAVFVHFGCDKCRALIPNMGYHTWPHVTSLSLNWFSKKVLVWLSKTIDWYESFIWLCYVDHLMSKWNIQFNQYSLILKRMTLLFYSGDIFCVWIRNTLGDLCSLNLRWSTLKSWFFLSNQTYTLKPVVQPIPELMAYWFKAHET